MPDSLGITIQEQIECVTREIGMRHRVYNSWVNQGKMKREKADREILVMQAVLATLRSLKEAGVIE